jgi:hypothetical protein
MGRPEAVGPAAGLTNLKSFGTNQGLADPLRPSQRPALVQARRTRSERSPGAPWESLGNVTVPYRLLAARPAPYTR